MHKIILCEKTVSEKGRDIAPTRYKSSSAVCGALDHR